MELKAGQTRGKSSLYPNVYSL